MASRSAATTSSPVASSKAARPSVFPNPISRAEATIPGDSDHRNLYCAHYDSCLVYAARKSWRDWSCASCSLNLGAKAPGAAQWATARIRQD